MKETKIFLKDKENCNENFTHIEDGITDPVLKEIDELYGAADVLSMEHAKTHHWNLWFLSVFGAATAFLFLLYDEAELHLLVFGCIVCIILIYISLEYTERKESHRKYTQYRLLAECLRVQYFLSIAGIKKNVSDILPWFVKAGVPWINEVLSELPQTNTNEKKPIINCWIRNQRDYHYKARVRLTRQQEKESRTGRRVIYITIATYLIAALFEIYMMISPTGEINIDILNGILTALQQWNIMVGYDQVDMIRAVLKIVLGTMSVITLFVGSYYGKMALSNTIDDHRRMEMLYEQCINKILQNNEEESEELILKLAQEFLIENSTWYAYQKNNQPDLTFE